jgi:MFS transporter, DHA2 family, multidrug resistance protein
MAGARATRREWTGLAIIALPCAVYAMDLTVLNLAVPVISAELKPSGSQLLWLIDIYGFLVAGFLITMGTLGDRIGRRKLLLIGAAAFGAASAAAAFARSAEMLIALRALLGVAGATVAPSTLALIRNMFRDEGQRQFAVGVWIASYSVGSAIGPLVGGLLLEGFGWNAVFWPALPVMGLLLLLGPRLLPEYKDPNAGRIDGWSVALSIAAVLVTIYAIKRMAEHGATPSRAALLLLGLAIGFVFVRRQRRLAYPLLDLSLFAQPRFSGAIAAYALSCLAMFGVYIFITQMLQQVLDLSPVQAGLATLPWSVGFAVGSLLAPKLAQRVPAVRLGVGGLVVAFGFGLLPFADGAHALAVLVASTVVTSLALSPVFTIGNEMIITAAPPERAGAASAISETSAEFSGALGVAVLGSIGIALYRRGLVQAVPQVPAEALATLGGALAAAQALGGEAGQALLGAARNAFVHAADVVAGVCTAIVAASAVLAGRILRRA